MDFGRLFVRCGPRSIFPLYLPALVHWYASKSMIEEAVTTFDSLQGSVVYPNREEFVFVLLLASKNWPAS